jgi:hypothetical protein
VGGASCALAGVLAWRHVSRGVFMPVAGSGLLLIVSALTYPAVLRQPSVLWWRFSKTLGAVNARILLVVLYFVTFIPTSLVWRVVGKDPLNRRRGQSAGWTPYPRRYRDRMHCRRMY